MRYRDGFDGIFQLEAGKERANRRECRLPQATRPQDRAGEIPRQIRDE